jgi:competence protein ComGC
MKNIVKLMVKIVGVGVGFLILVSIIIMLSLLLFGHSKDSPDDHKIEESKAILRAVQDSLQQYYKDKKKYPENLQKLVDEGYLLEDRLKDPWNNYNEYVKRDENYILMSCGIDGKLGTDDDVEPPINTGKHSMKKYFDTIRKK